MKKKFLLFGLGLSLFFSGALKAQTVNPNNVYTFTYNGKTYEVIKELKSWTAAATIAVDRGGYLVEIGSREENQAVYNAVVGTSAARVSSTYTAVPDGGGAAYVWIGGTDRLGEGAWVWDGNNDGISFASISTGQGAAGTNNFTSSSYYNWGGTSQIGTFNPMTQSIRLSPNEPDDYMSNQDCAALALGSWPQGGFSQNGMPTEWNDLDGSNTLYFVVEKDNPTSDKELVEGGGVSVKSKNNTVLVDVPESIVGQKFFVYNTLSKLVMAGVIENTTNEIDIASLSSGVYILQLNGELNKSFKFIKN